MREGIIVEEHLEPFVEALSKLPPSDQGMVCNLIRGFAEKAGISISDVARTEVRPAIEFLELWLTKVRSERFSERTIRSYRWAIEHFLQDDSHPTTQSIRTYLAKRLDGGVSANHVNLERKALKSFFDFLHADGLWPANPMTGIKAIPVHFRQPELPSEEGIQKLLTAEFYRREDEVRFRLMTTLLLDTALRVSEACGILKSKLDMSRPSIRIIGKGDKERDVPISVITASMIGEYLAEFDQPDNPYLFPSRVKKDAHWDYTNVERVMMNVCDRLEIERIHPHQLRHFAATTMLKDGANLEVVSRLLGHSSVAITGKVYRHVDEEEMDEQHRKHGALNGFNGTEDVEE